MFFGVLPGCALADDGFFTVKPAHPISVRLSDSDSGYPSELVNLSLSFSQSFNPSIGSFPNTGTTGIFSDIGSTFATWYSRNNISSAYVTGIGSPFNFNLSFSQTFSDPIDNFSFSWYPASKFFYGMYVADSFFYFDYVPAVCQISGNFTIYFSDGSSVVRSVLSNQSLSFSIERDPSNQYIMSSDDFYLASDDVTAPVNISIGSFTADMSATGVQFFSSGYNTSLRTDQIPSNGGNGPFTVNNRIEVSNQETSGGHYFNMYATKLAFQCLSATLSSETVQFDNVNVNSQANLDSIDIDHGIVDQSLVTLTPAPDVLITGFSFSGQLTFPAQLFDHFFSESYLPFYSSEVLPDPVTFSPLFAVSFNHVFTYGSDLSLFSSLVTDVKSIASFLRYDLPLQLRHLIIPTTEEVQDVITDASDDIKQNAGGLGQAWDMVDTEMHELQQAIGSGSATPVILPKLEFDCFGVEVKLWDDIDFAPYLQSDVVKLLMIPAELMAIYILANNLLRHFYLMYVCLTSGMSYGAFLRYLTSKVD